jgi:hypothetical protein
VLASTNATSWDRVWHTKHLFGYPNPPIYVSMACVRASWRPLPGPRFGAVRRGHFGV